MTRYLSQLVLPLVAGGGILISLCATGCGEKAAVPPTSAGYYSGPLKKKPVEQKASKTGSRAVKPGGAGSDL